MRLRLLLCLAAVSASVLSHAYFLQQWTKTLPTNTTVAEVTVDSAGNTLVVGTDTTGDNAIYVTKVSPTGTNLWTQKMAIAGSTTATGRSIVVDSSGSVFIEYIANKNLTVRKLRGTDGVTLGTFVVPDIIDAWEGRSDLVIDGANNVYLAARYFVLASQLGGLLVVNINSGSPANSTIRRVSAPYLSEIVQCRPRPQGGVNILAGIEVDSKIPDGTFLSSLYSFGPAGSPTVTPVGYATTFASIPGTTETLIAGSMAETLGYIHLQEVSATSEIVNARNDIVGNRTSAFNDVFVSKFGIAITGGRVLEYLKHLAPDPKNAILLIGYQAEGTRGRRLKNGERELKIHGQFVPVKASIEDISGLSGHADQAELLQWLGQMGQSVQKVILVHGEGPAQDTFRKKIEQDLHIPAFIAKEDEETTLFNL